MASSSRVRLALASTAVLVALASILALSAQVLRGWPHLPPLNSAETVVKPLPNVVLMVQDLARLQTVSFHMERVMDLTEKQSRLFGLIETEDALLLIAVADVAAGVDLGKVAPADIEVDAAARRVRLRLPAPEIFQVVFDNEHTYVHTRRTGLLAHRQEALEARARAEAERALLEAAKEAGILQRAAENARRTLEGLLRSLGYQSVEIVGEAGSSPG